MWAASRSCRLRSEPCTSPPARHRSAETAAAPTSNPTDAAARHAALPQPEGATLTLSALIDQLRAAANAPSFRVALDLGAAGGIILNGKAIEPWPGIRCEVLPYDRSRDARSDPRQRDRLLGCYQAGRLHSAGEHVRARDARILWIAEQSQAQLRRCLYQMILSLDRLG